MAFNDLDDAVKKDYEKSKDSVKEGIRKTGDKIEHLAD